METKNQTAVEWLVKIYLQTGKIDSFDINQAKAMEKDQITQAVYDGMGTNFDPNMGRAEQYYNETYNK
jgi:hypothetical protein